MTSDPKTVDAGAPVVEAARIMADADVGAVMVVDGGRVAGIVTDRDVTVRAVAKGHDPASTPVREVCSAELTTLTPEDTVDDAVRLVRAKALRRLPVVEGGRPGSCRLATWRSSGSRSLPRGHQRRAPEAVGADGLGGRSRWRPPRSPRGWRSRTAHGLPAGGKLVLVRLSPAGP